MIKTTEVWKRVQEVDEKTEYVYTLKVEVNEIIAPKSPGYGNRTVNIANYCVGPRGGIQHMGTAGFTEKEWNRVVYEVTRHLATPTWAELERRKKAAVEDDGPTYQQLVEAGEEYEKE